MLCLALIGQSFADQVRFITSWLISACGIFARIISSDAKLVLIYNLGARCDDTI